MARLTDNLGNLLGGLKVTWDTQSPPLNISRATSNPAPIPPHFGEKETVHWLECSYGNMGYLTFSSGQPRVPSPEAGPDARPYDCHSQVDSPHKRHYCPACGGYYCIIHAEPAAHHCQTVIITPLSC